ncbi:hypothetical protein D3C78_1370800 [compost metagenome]
MVVRHQFLIKTAGRQHADGMAAGPDQRHIAFQHIQKLRQFVDIRAAKNRADPGYSGIVLHRLRHTGGIAKVGSHGAEFIDTDFPPVHTPADLRKQDRPFAIEFDQSRYGEQHRRERDKGDGRPCNIHRSFERELAAQKCGDGFFRRGRLRFRRFESCGCGIGGTVKNGMR